jgi:hypothetical protein
MPTLEKMTLQEFEALRPLLGRLALDTVDIARAVLVEGVKPAEAATRNHMSRQRVHGIVQRFRAAARQVPATWRRVEVWLPPELAAQVEAIAAKARDDHAAGVSYGKGSTRAPGADPLHAAAEG